LYIWCQKWDGLIHATSKTNYWIYEYIEIIRPQNGEAINRASNGNAENHAGKQPKTNKRRLENYASKNGRKHKNYARKLEKGRRQQKN
jgi:hypothetical protein